MFLIIFVVLLITFFYYNGVKPFGYWKAKGVATLKPVPFLGNIAPNFTRKKAYAELLTDFYTAFPDKRYVGFYQFGKPILLIRDVELIKQIFVRDFDTFPAHWPFVPEDIDPLWGSSLVAILDKHRWREMRGALSPLFTSSKMKVMFDLMKACAKQYTAHYLARDPPIIVEFKDSFRRFANDIIASLAFGVSCDSFQNPQNEFFEMGCEATDFSGVNGLRFFLAAMSPLIMKSFRIGIYNRKVSRFFKNVINEAIRHREDSHVTRADLIHQLKDLRKTLGINNEIITAQALIFFFAGFDTVSGALSFTMYELGLNTEVQEKLRNEVDQALERCNGELTYDEIMGMKYLDMVLAEGLRKWPPTISTDRISVAPYTIEADPRFPHCNKVDLDTNTNIWVPIFSIHRDPKHYPTPEKFDPERFSDANKTSLNPFAYLPFGAGPRNCIGSRFGLLECKILIAEIISKFQIVQVPQTQVPLKLHTTNVPLLAENGTWMGLKPRAF